MAGHMAIGSVEKKDRRGSPVRMIHWVSTGWITFWPIPRPQALDAIAGHSIQATDELRLGAAFLWDDTSREPSPPACAIPRQAVPSDGIRGLAAGMMEP